MTRPGDCESRRARHGGFETGPVRPRSFESVPARPEVLKVVQPGPEDLKVARSDPKSRRQIWPGPARRWSDPGHRPDPDLWWHISTRIYRMLVICPEISIWKLWLHALKKNISKNIMILSYISKLRTHWSWSAATCVFYVCVLNTRTLIQFIALIFVRCVTHNNENILHIIDLPWDFDLETLIVCIEQEHFQKDQDFTLHLRAENTLKLERSKTFFHVYLLSTRTNICFGQSGPALEILKVSRSEIFELGLPRTC